MKVLFVALLLTGCVTAEPWRTGISIENTGKLTRYESAKDIPVIRVRNENEFIERCGKIARACYLPYEDVIILGLGAGKFELVHEQGHAMYGTEHNNCKGYSFGKDESACDWNNRKRAVNE